MKNRINFYWRVIGSGISFTIFGLGMLVLSLVFFLMVRFLPVSKRVKHRWVLASVRHMSRSFVWLMRIFGLFTLRRVGLQSLPAGGHLIIANHPSLIDALFITAHTDNLCCVVKKALLRNPFTAYIVRLAGYIPNHSETLLDDSAAALAAGKNLLVFPEGTRNTAERQLDFKRGAANIALYANCPITPVTIEMSDRLLQKEQRWYHMPGQTAQIIVTAHAPLNPHDAVNTALPITLQARQLNSALVSFYEDKLRFADPEPVERAASRAPGHVAGMGGTEIRQSELGQAVVKAAGSAARQSTG